MRTRTLGRKGWEVSEVGFGAWGIGGGLWVGSDDRQAMKALHRAVDLGIRFFDTALVYGQGHSEKLIGRLLRERKEPIRIATKIPPKTGEWPVPWERSLQAAFPKNHIVSCTERSLRNLGVERIDLQQLHVWSPHWAEEPDWEEALTRLREQGKLDRIGISLNDHQPDTALALARAGRVDAFQVIYNIFDPTPAQRLFPACQAAGIGIIARCPFDEGALTGSITARSRIPRQDWRSDYFRGKRKAEVARRVDRLRTLLETAGVRTVSALSLRFCLSHAAVSTVIPGMRTPEHVQDNADCSDGRPLPKEVLRALAEMAWPKNFYD